MTKGNGTAILVAIYKQEHTLEKMDYSFIEIEKKWQKIWKEQKTFKTDSNTKKEKYYLLDMFPYPSGSGLHVGHASGYTATDILSRYKRMMGFEVLHPMGWDSFGLAAEQYAIRTKIHPSITTQENIDVYRRQIQSLGLSYDWDREFRTSEPSYYRWTQWIFTKLYEKGLAYEANILVNYCPQLRTVLANEEVENGKSVEGGYPVERRPLRQWVLKITEYAERLLTDLDDLNWPESLKTLQRNWIGKSEGVEVVFEEEKTKCPLKAFTTRIDTLSAVTFLVVSPEHPILKDLVTPEQKGVVEAYLQEIESKSDLERTDLNKNKTGIFTGSYATVPLINRQIPIWIADYVLMGYGTGIVMGVPFDDERDREFATKYHLPVIATESEECSIEALKERWANALIQEGKGRHVVQYKLRDWLFSRQRYWGEPIPILHFEDGTKRLLTDDELPLLSPELEDYTPSEDGNSPLARVESWVHITDQKTGKKALRETNTMPQWAGSCWYYLRFIDPHNGEKAWDIDLEKKWMPVDLYVGGVEHAVLHLLYARFWHKVLFDLGLVSTKEPFKEMKNQGLITAYAYKLETGGFVAPKDIEEKEGGYFEKETGREVKKLLEKMSKSKLNGVSPDEVVAEYGADTLRLYVTFMGPFDKEKIWNSEAIVGCHRFLHKSYDLCTSDRVQDCPPSKEALQLMHKMIDGVGRDLQTIQLNTAISKMMEFVNQFQKLPMYPKEALIAFVKCLSPFAPHIAEELYEKLGEKDKLAFAPFPKADPSYLIEDTVTFAIQVNGKLRASKEFKKGIEKERALLEARSLPQVQKYLEGKILKEIFVPDKIINFVVASE